jgi:hypothetical protein
MLERKVRPVKKERFASSARPSHTESLSLAPAFAIPNPILAFIVAPHHHHLPFPPTILGPSVRARSSPSVRLTLRLSSRTPSVPGPKPWVAYVVFVV